MISSLVADANRDAIFGKNKPLLPPPCKAVKWREGAKRAILVQPTRACLQRYPATLSTVHQVVPTKMQHVADNSVVMVRKLGWYDSLLCIVPICEVLAMEWRLFFSLNKEPDVVNRTQSNPIARLGSIEFGNQT